MLTALRTFLAQRAVSVLILRSRSFSSSVVPSSLERVGFIGLGNMGFHMANNLINAGYKLTVHDIDENVMKKFSERGIFTSKTPSEVADKSDVVITMLPSSPHVLSVYTGPNGLLHDVNQTRPWLFIDSSTIDPHTSRKLSSNISKCFLKEKKGSADKPTMLDAPVSGGVLGAAAGTLTFMVGGLEDAYIAAKPLFLAMGKSSIYCGGPGNGAHARGIRGSCSWSAFRNYREHSYKYIQLLYGSLLEQELWKGCLLQGAMTVVSRRNSWPKT
ncbi:hypothetical protein HPP92_026081 [Vanilla planifolia]|uniref:3-hydroxyisobutyrate dehydrogenase n=1 Tax=Vanilla planifolia TaxID=51239 RepID=A0A835PK59_VANPL|nr:hypothetical protein HPP92_026081 [Vanilla planifolia]